MADLLLDYTVLDAVYTHGKFRFISGDNSADPPVINDPADTRIDDIRAYQDPDPEVFSYLNGSNPRALLVNVTTDFSIGTSSGKYTVCVPNISGTAVSWDFLKDSSGNLLAKDITLVDGSGNSVAGNPYGVVKIGNFLYLVEYDTANVYRLGFADLEVAAAGSNVEVTVSHTSPSFFPANASVSRGAALVTLTDHGATYLYALFTSVDSNGDYLASTILRYMVNTTSGTLGTPLAVRVGKNAMSLVPAVFSGTIYLLVPAVGGSQQANQTNSTDSNLCSVDAFGAFTAANIRFTGDASPTVTQNGNYDIRGVAVSADGSNAYLLAVTYDANYKACWRVYNMDLAGILLHGDSSKTIKTMINAHLLASRDSGFGDPGYYWEVLYDNTVSGGRLWFLKGSPIRVSTGGSYNMALKQISYGGSLCDSAFNVNSADLIGEMIYQAAQGAVVNTRLGTARHLARAVQAAKAATEEEEK